MVNPNFPPVAQKILATARVWNDIVAVEILQRIRRLYTIPGPGSSEDMAQKPSDQMRDRFIEDLRGISKAQARGRWQTHSNKCKPQKPQLENKRDDVLSLGIVEASKQLVG